VHSATDPSDIVVEVAGIVVVGGGAVVDASCEAQLASNRTLAATTVLTKRIGLDRTHIAAHRRRVASGIMHHVPRAWPRSTRWTVTPLRGDGSAIQAEGQT
jgi:hypothetical protein